MKKKLTKIYELPVVVEKDEKNYFFAYAPSLQGCYAQGRTLMETLNNIKDVMKLHIEDRIATKETISSRRPVSFSSVEVTV